MIDPQLQYKFMNKYHDKAYTCWHSLMQRVGKIPGYFDCTMSNEWKDLDTFSNWYHQQPVEIYQSYQLDKDMLIKGNRHYSENTACLIPEWLNQFISRPQNSGQYPTGVTPCLAGYKGLVRILGDDYKVGTCRTIEAVCEALSEIKFRVIHREADRLEQLGALSANALQGMRAYDFTVRPKNIVSNSSKVASA